MKYKCHNCYMVFRINGFDDNSTSITRCDCGIRFEHYQQSSSNQIVCRADTADLRTRERIYP